MASLISLTTQLETDVPSLNGTPSAAQYTQVVKDAVADLGRRMPQTVRVTLAVVSGTASYDLPADFVRLIRLSGPVWYGDVLITDAGIVPIAQPSGLTCRETYAVRGSVLTIHPTPEYSQDRTLWYAAGDALGDDEYATLDENRAQIALSKARAIALGLQAAKAAADAWVSELGPEKVDKTKQAAELRAAATFHEAQYAAAIAAQSGPYGTRS